MTNTVACVAVIAAFALLVMVDAGRVQDPRLSRASVKGRSSCETYSSFAECPHDCVWSWNGEGCTTTPPITCGNIFNGEAAVNKSFCLSISVFDQNPYPPKNAPAPRRALDTFHDYKFDSNATVIQWPQAYIGSFPGTVFFAVENGITKDGSGHIVKKLWYVCAHYRQFQGEGAEFTFCGQPHYFPLNPIVCAQRYFMNGISSPSIIYSTQPRISVFNMSVAIDSLAGFASLSIPTLNRRRVAKLVIGKAGAALTVFQACTAFPQLERWLYRYAAGRAALTWSNPAVVVAELARVGLHIGMLRVLEGHVPTGRFKSLHHLAMFFDSSFQCFIPRPLRSWVAYTPLSNDAIAGVLSSLSRDEIIGSVVVQTISNLASWIPVCFLKAWQERLPYNFVVTSLQMSVDVVSIASIHYGSLRFLQWSGFKNIWAINSAWTVFYLIAAFTAGATVGLAAGPISSVYDRLTGLGDPENARVPETNLQRLSYLKSFCALELDALLSMCRTIIEGPWDNGMRLHAAKLTADIITFQVALQKGNWVQKRRHQLMVSTAVLDASTYPPGTELPDCLCGCGKTLKRGDTVQFFPCGHAILQGCEENYDIEICKVCMPAVPVIIVPDTERDAMQKNLEKVENALLERWSRTTLLPHYVQYAPWSEVAKFCKRHQMATKVELSMVSGDCQPAGTGMMDYCVDFFFLVLDVNPSEWAPMTQTLNVV